MKKFLYSTAIAKISLVIALVVISVSGAVALGSLQGSQVYASNAYFAADNTNKDAIQKVPAQCDADTLDAGNCRILAYFTAFTKALSAMVGVVVAAMIIVGGIQYSAAGSDPQKVAAAKSKITNALLALVIFIFMLGFLQWLVPGGVF